MKLISTVLFWLAWPLLFILLRLSRRTRVLMVHEGDVLVMKSWLGDGKWQLPGGGLHRNEMPEQGAVREVKEELGITLKPSDLNPRGEYRYQDSGLAFTYSAFEIRFAIRPTIKKRWWEVAEADWVPYRTLTDKSAGSDVIQLLDGWKP